MLYVIRNKSKYILKQNILFFKHNLFSYFVIISNVITTLFSVKYYLTVFGVDKYGVWIIASSLSSFMYILNFGYPSVAIYNFSKYKNSRTRQVFFSTNFLIIIANSLFVLLSFFVINMFSSSLTKDYLSLFTNLLLCLLPSTLFNLVSSYVEGLLFYNFKLVYYKNLLDFLRISFFHSVSFLCIHLINSIYVLSFVSSVISLIILIISISRLKSKVPISISSNFDFKYIKSTFRDAISYWTLSFSYFVTSQTDSILISVFVKDLSSVTSYSQSFRLQEIGTRFIKKLIESKIPKMLSLYNNGNLLGFVDLTQKLMYSTLSLSLILCIFIVFFGESLLNLWLGNLIEFDQVLISVLSLIAVLSCFHYLLWNFCATANMQKKLNKIVVFEILANISLSLLLVNFIGLKGLAVATVISSFITVCFMLFMFLKFKIRYC